MSTISHTSEDTLIATLTKDLSSSSEVIVGVGDDCAVLERNEHHHTLLKTDTVVEHIHFTSGEIATRVGWKAAARVISDFAAMGGQPEALLVTIILPPETELSWIKDVYVGLQACARRFSCSIVGGETSSTVAGSPKIISISGTGKVKPHHLTLRSGGSPGDLIYVTGRLGGSIKGKHLDFTPRLHEALWLVKHLKPSSMMDLSDGVAKDLPRLSKLSGCGFEIFKSKLPLSHQCTTKQALKDGEDYELLFTIPAASQQELEPLWSRAFPDLKLSHIGNLTTPAVSQPPLEGGWDHFKSPTSAT